VRRTNCTFFAPVAIAVAGAFFCATAVLADVVEMPTEEFVDQVVVVAHKDQRSIREIAANVTVLSRAELNDELATSISDVLRYIPGVELR